MLQYAFNASEARNLCSFLGLNIASKVHLKEALARGLETCRFGWVDEHFAIVPRNKPLFICGQNGTGLVTWRAPVTQKFDVFCFNKSDAEAQLRMTAMTDSAGISEQTQFSSQALNSTQSGAHTSSSFPQSSTSAPPETESTEAQPARFLGGAQSYSGAKVILITSTCAIILLAVIIVAYIKTRQGRSQSSDLKQHEEDIQTEEWTCLKTIKQSEAADNLRIEVDCEAS